MDLLRHCFKSHLFLRVNNNRSFLPFSSIQKQIYRAGLGSRLDFQIQRELAGVNLSRLNDWRSPAYVTREKSFH